MAPDQIINQIWLLPWYQVMKIALYDDFILFCKTWPVWIGMLLISGLIGWKLGKK